MPSCLHPPALNLLLILLGLFILGFTFNKRISSRYNKLILITNALLIALTLWLGDYRYSPLTSIRGDHFTLQEFIVLTREKGEIHIAPNEIITLGSSSAAFIQPVPVTENMTCHWRSLEDGQLDGEDSCALTYIPPRADYDILRLNIQPGCGRPSAVEQIRVSILP
ncbi:MAG: hypothetical protein DCC56_12115 [Anaerolineae bacterium]|nr:MAG: hypothetical protein DCC56_12115 [Anaerolineae bacterium]WKZ42305.1 MAG: hypothetical protein QY302_09375 [Anaerolineales bacterium]